MVLVPASRKCLFQFTSEFSFFFFVQGMRFWFCVCLGFHS